MGGEKKKILAKLCNHLKCAQLTDVAAIREIHNFKMSVKKLINADGACKQMSVATIKIGN